MTLIFLIVGVIIIALFVVSLVFKAVKLFFRILGTILIILSLIGAIFGVVAYQQGQELNKKMAAGPVVLFTEDGEYIAGAVLPSGADQELSSELQTYDRAYFQGKDLADIENRNNNRVLLAFRVEDLDFSVADRLNSTYEEIYIYIVALNTTTTAQGKGFIVEGYFDNSVTIYPEPPTFVFLRTQQFLPIEWILSQSLFRRVVGLDDDEA